MKSTDNNNIGCTRIQDAFVQNDSPLFSGILALDTVKQGWNAGELCIVGGRPVIGKTGFMLSLMANLSRANVPVLLLSATDTMNRRFVSRVKNAIAEAERPVVDANDAPFYLNLSSSMTLSFIRDNVKAMIEQKGIRFVFIETIQSIFDSEPDGYTTESTARVCHELRLISREFNIPFVVTSELSRAVECRGGFKYPLISDLRSSGAIEIIADSIILLHRPEYYGFLVDFDGKDYCGREMVIVAKNKYGDTGEVWLKYNKALGTVKDMDHSQTSISSFQPDNSTLSPF